MANHGFVWGDLPFHCEHSQRERPIEVVVQHINSKPIWCFKNGWNSIKPHFNDPVFLYYPTIVEHIIMAESARIKQERKQKNKNKPRQLGFDAGRFVPRYIWLRRMF